MLWIFPFVFCLCGAVGEQPVLRRCWDAWHAHMICLAPQLGKWLLENNLADSDLLRALADPDLRSQEGALADLLRKPPNSKELAEWNSILEDAEHFADQKHKHTARALDFPHLRKAIT